ncbi:MAG: GntR family transcriptional regulator [Rhodospirillales bacterium]|nr:GntR family transcriptional regulator [Rhodospirillales bacterium]
MGNQKTKSVSRAQLDGNSLINVTIDNLVRAIVDGDFLPGQRLVIAELAKRFDVGPMPVRQALLRLEGEGLVEASPNRGAVVRRVDAEMVGNIYEVRLCLETLLVTKCVAEITSSDISAISSIQREYEAEIAGGYNDNAFQLNREFHYHINRLGNNAEALVILERGSRLIAALRARYGFSATRLEDVSNEHRALINALRQGDEKDAASIIRMHTTAARKDMLKRMENS